MSEGVEIVVVIACAIAALLCVIKLAAGVALWKHRKAAPLQFPHFLLFPVMLAGSIVADAFVLIRLAPANAVTCILSPLFLVISECLVIVPIVVRIWHAQRIFANPMRPESFADCRYAPAHVLIVSLPAVVALALWFVFEPPYVLPQAAGWNSSYRVPRPVQRAAPGHRLAPVSLGRERPQGQGSSPRWTVQLSAVRHRGPHALRVPPALPFPPGGYGGLSAAADRSRHRRPQVMHEALGDFDVACKLGGGDDGVCWPCVVLWLIFFSLAMGGTAAGARGLHPPAASRPTADDARAPTGAPATARAGAAPPDALLPEPPLRARRLADAAP